MFDISKATCWIKENCSRNILSKTSKPVEKSIGRCALYVRSAMEAGGINTNGRPVNAKDYWKSGFLTKIGFKQLQNAGYVPQAGDLCVLDYAPHGHIAMFDGSNWVSDFKQRNVLVGKPASTPIAYFRYNH